MHISRMYRLSLEIHQQFANIRTIEGTMCMKYHPPKCLSFFQRPKNRGTARFSPHPRPPPLARETRDHQLANRWLVCVLQQPKPGEPLYAQVNLEKKKKRQYELGVGQGGQVGQAGGGGGAAIPGGGGGIAGPGGGGGQWVPDGVGMVVPDGTGATSVAATVANQVPPPSSTAAAAAAGDSWV